MTAHYGAQLLAICPGLLAEAPAILRITASRRQSSKRKLWKSPLPPLVFFKRTLPLASSRSELVATCTCARQRARVWRECEQVVT